MTEPSPFPERDARAAHLAGERPHASEILGHYRQVLALQEPLYESALALRWADGGLAALPWAELDAPFRRLLEELAPSVSEPLAEAGRSLAGASEATRLEVLRRTLEVGELGDLASSLGAGLPQITFWSRAFLEPLALAAAVRARPGHPGGASDGEPPGLCPLCGWPPQAAVVQDEPERRGGRSLVCALCTTPWPFPRIRCPGCGEGSSEALIVHEAEALPHVRVEECTSCRAYWKSVDLRQDGRAVAVVEDLATPELDLWAAERDLWKPCRNLVGL